MTRWATLLLTVTFATGCSAAPAPEPPAPPASSPSPTPDPTRTAPPPSPPRDGTCHDLSFAEAVAPTSRASEVSCDDEHTARTFHVGTLDRVVGGRLLAVDARRLQDEAAQECPARLATLLGGTEEDRRLSMLRAVWFTPSVAQSDRGADWLRCDAVAVAGPERLLPLTGPLGGVLDTEAGRDRYGMCGTAEPGTDGFERVACATEHGWRALRTVPLPAGDYPGEDAAQAVGEAPCTDAGRAAADDPLDFQWGYEWPTSEQWAAGQTYGICWAPEA